MIGPHQHLVLVGMMGVGKTTVAKVVAERLGRPVVDTDHAIEAMTAPGSAAVIGTPDDLVKMIKSVYEQSGGFGTVVGFVHDWANPANTPKSWDMVARYVIPEINGWLAGLRKSRAFVAENREYFDRARQAVMAKIQANEAAAAALAVPLLRGRATPVPKRRGKRETVRKAASGAKHRKAAAK